MLCVVVVVVVVALVVWARVVAFVVVDVVFDLDIEALVVEDAADASGDTLIEHSRAAMQAN